MSDEILRKAIANQMKDNWSATEQNRVVHGRNRDGLVAEENSPWVRCRFTIQDTFNAEIGTGFQRSTGIITVECFVKANSGTKKMNTLLDDARLVFQNKNFNGVQTFAATPVEVGKIGDSFQVNQKIEFQYDVFS